MNEPLWLEALEPIFSARSWNAQKTLQSWKQACRRARSQVWGTNEGEREKLTCKMTQTSSLSVYAWTKIMSPLPHSCHHACQKSSLKPDLHRAHKLSHLLLCTPAHTALNLTRPGGIKCQTVSAFLVCVMGGSAERQTTVQAKWQDDRLPQTKPVRAVTQHFYLLAFRENNQIIQEVKRRERKQGRKRINPTMIKLQLLTEHGTASDTEQGLTYIQTHSYTNTCKEQAIMWGIVRVLVVFMSLRVH